MLLESRCAIVGCLSNLPLVCVEPGGGGGLELGRVCSGAGCSGHHCRLVLLARWGHIMLWGGHWDCPQRLTLICLFACFQGLQSQEEEYSPHRKKKEEEIVQKGMMKCEKQQEMAWESGEASGKGNKF